MKLSMEDFEHSNVSLESSKIVSFTIFSTKKSICLHKKRQMAGNHRLTEISV